MKRKIVIYTAITGGYDKLTAPTVVNKDIDYICFTDNPSTKSTVWRMLPVVDNGLDLARQNRQYKLLPHRFLAEYKYSLYIDGNIDIIGDITQLIQKHMVSCSIAFFSHYQRNCVYEEARACIKQKKDGTEAIKKQIQRYRDEGYPRNNGLIEGGIILRRHNDLKIIKTMEAWWNELINESRRDQLSFNYVAWKNNTRYAIMGPNLRENCYFRLRRHV